MTDEILMNRIIDDYQTDGTSREIDQFFSNEEDHYDVFEDDEQGAQNADDDEYDDDIEGNKIVEEVQEKNSKEEENQIDKLMKTHKRVSVYSYMKEHGFDSRPAKILKGLNSTFGSEFVKLDFVTQWSKHFREGKTSVKDAPRSGQPKKVQDSEIINFVDQNHGVETKNIAENFGMTIQGISKRLKSLNYYQKRKLWVPHTLNEVQKAKRLNAAKQLLEEHKNSADYFDGFITVDEKWVYYENPTSGKFWTNKDRPQLVQQPIRNIHCPKVVA